MTIVYRDDKGISPEDVSNVFRSSGIKRPYEDLLRLEKMIEGADMVITAWDGGKIVGLARALTDYAYCCYLSDLAVDADYKQSGIGRRLIEEVRARIGDECSLVLLSAASTGLPTLPPPEECRRIFRAAAMLDAIISPEWESRYYSYTAAWCNDEEMASMCDEKGNHYFAWFSPHGLVIKGFDHELVKAGETRIGVGRVPDVVAEFLREPAFVGKETTFCFWMLSDESDWTADRTYSEEEVRLLWLLFGGAEHYREWASDYYETEVDLEAVKWVFAQEPMTEELLRSLNEELTLEDLAEDLEEIGYPRS